MLHYQCSIFNLKRMPIKIPYDGTGSTSQPRATSNGRANNNRLSRDMEMQTTKGWLGERFDKIPLLSKLTIVLAHL